MGPDPKLPGSGNFWSWLRQQGDTNTLNPARYTTQAAGVSRGLAGAAKTVSATYMYQYNSFMPIGPHCAVADVRVAQNQATIYTAAQALTGMPANLAGVINSITGGSMPPQNVRVIWYEGASSFGGGQSAEVGEQAAILSAKLGKPVRVQWMRSDQHGWDHHGMANLWDVTMGIDGSGKIVAADWTSYGQAQSNIDETKRALGTATWPATPGAGGIVRRRTGAAVCEHDAAVLAKPQPLYDGAFRCNFLRAVGAPQQFFAGEQIIDGPPRRPS